MFQNFLYPPFRANTRNGVFFFPTTLDFCTCILFFLFLSMPLLLARSLTTWLLVDGMVAHWWRGSTCFNCMIKFHVHHDSILEMSILHFVNFVQRQNSRPLVKARWPSVRPNDKKSINSVHRSKLQNVVSRLCSKFHAESFDVNFNFLSIMEIECW